MPPFLTSGKFRDRLYTIGQRFQNYPNLHRAFLRNQGYPLNLKNPQTHSERIVHKMINDRNPLIPLTLDKWKVRGYVRQKLGESLSREILVPIYFVGKTGKDIPYTLWNHEFFLKANHGSGFNKLISEGEDPQKVIDLAESWLCRSFGQVLHEWGYRDIPRRIICEKVLRDSLGNIPMDLKFYCYHGKCRMVYYYSDRFTQPAQLITDEKGTVFPNLLQKHVRLLPEVPKVENYNQLLKIAEALSEDFVFCRVDLYSVEGKSYFGEITQYDGAGMERLLSYEVDLAVGRLWLPQNKNKSLMNLYEDILWERGLSERGD